MATLLPVEPPKPTAFDLIIRALYILIPVCVSAFATYKQGQSESSAGYKALATTVVELQQEATALQAQDEELQEQLQALTGQLQVLSMQLTALRVTPAVGQGTPTAKSRVSATTAPAPETTSKPLLEAEPRKPLKRLQQLLRPPPATLKEAVNAD